MKTLRPPSPLTIFTAFLRLGLTAFGGPAMVAYIRTLCVEENDWVTEKDFRDGVALVQTIPGATAMQAAAYAGLRTAGPAGALAAYSGFALPAFLLMLALSTAYRHGNDLAPVISLFSGLQLIVIAMVAKAALDFGKKTLKSWKDLLLITGGAAYIATGGSPVTVIIVSAISAPFLYTSKPATPFAEKEMGMESEKQKQPGTEQPAKSPAFRAGCIAAGVIATLLGLLFLLDRELFGLAWIMIKIDMFAFGGGYASLPMMLHELVNSTGLLDAKTLMDGIALGQITPGPIVITATFAGLLLHGITGAVVATISVFSPSFIILLFVIPWFDRIRHSDRFRRAMRGILCSFTGLLVAVTINFAMATQWGVGAVIICAASFTALAYKINMLWIVLAGGGLAVLIL